MKVLIPSVFELKETSVDESDVSYPNFSDTVTYEEGDRVKRPYSSLSPTLPERRYTSLRDENTHNWPWDNTEPAPETATSTTSLTVGMGEHSLTIDTEKSFLPGMEITIAKTATPRTVSMSAEVVSYNSTTGALVASAYSTTGSGTIAAWTITSVDEITFWRDDGVSSPFLMFESNNEQTTALEEIEVKLLAYNIGSVALFQLGGLSVEVEVWDTDETEQLYSATHGITKSIPTPTLTEDQFEYDYGGLRQKTELLIDLDDVYVSAIVIIRILSTAGYYASCGLCVPGRTVTLGATQYGLSLGLTNYSSVDEDDNGAMSITAGYSAKRNSLSLRVDNNRIDHVYNIISALNGTPTAWLGNSDSTDYSSLAAYGIFSDFDITVPGPISSICTIEVTGLIDYGNQYLTSRLPIVEGTTNAATWEQDDEIDLTVPFTM